MAASNQIFLVVDAGTPVAAFTARQELKAYLRRRLDVFINPLVYTSRDVLTGYGSTLPDASHTKSWCGRRHTRAL
jgi:hypothetical protein